MTKEHCWMAFGCVVVIATFVVALFIGALFVQWLLRAV